MRELVINKNDANQRLDKFLTKYMPSLPQSMLYKSLRKDCVRVNGKHIKNGAYILKEGDELKLYMRDEFFETKKESIPDFVLDEKCIIYEDNHILIIDKPIGMSVHTDDNGSADNLINRIKGYLYKKGEYNPENEHSFSPALCNRLDKNTPGLIIAAKTAAALRIINEKIRIREIKKFYLCEAQGHTPKSGILEGYLKKGDKSVTVTDMPTDGAKPIKTGFKAIEYKNNSTVLEIELFTGRTHQIRAHMAHIGHPLLGDVKYGAKKIPDFHYALHSYKLKFDFQTDADELEYLKGKVFKSKLNII